MPKMNYKLLDSLDQLEQNAWDAVFGKIPEGYLFFKALASSEFPEFRFYYLVMESDNDSVSIAPLFSADFNLDIAVEGRLSKFIRSIRKVFPRFLIIKTLFCGSPFGEYGVLGIKQGFKDNPGIIPLLLQGIKNCQIRVNAPLVIFKDFLKQDTLFLDVLLPKGYSKVESFPAVGLELNFTSFEGYLESLGSFDRKYLNRKLKQAYSRGKIEVKVVLDVASEIDQIFQLYENTYQKGATKFEHLTKKFFLQIARNLSPHTRFFLYYVDGRLAAFNLCFIYDNLFIDKFIGFDYEISKQFNLYFVSQAYNIKWCLNNSLCYYYSGQTNYETKLRLDGKLITLYAYLKHKNMFFNFFLKLFIPLFKPDNFDQNERPK
ncbi:MAG: GNAT family N-acetyltransferase [Candidatus Omnitrophota bacterium]